MQMESFQHQELQAKSLAWTFVLDQSLHTSNTLSPHQKHAETQSLSFMKVCYTDEHYEHKKLLNKDKLMC